ncbi:MAG: DUF3106 domain-containing protein, partial [Betaproteobacteria bacterium]|nr:DUF3106 domain-containing protein [Betaproteobacteria bacterium]
MGLGSVSAQNANTPSGKPATTQAPQDAGWQALKPQQKKALAPLAPHWSQISVAQKSKWLAMSNNFDN